MTATIPAQTMTSVWRPFRHRTFAVLWFATVVSNIGSWMYAAAAGWQMTLLDPSPTMVSLVQAVSALPVFIFALPAGALADIVDRRKLLLFAQTLLLVLVLIYALLTLFDQITPRGLLAFAFLIGVGTALVAPAWQAIVPDLVPKPDLQSAIALNSVGINISRAIGPALAGLFISAFGIASPYFVDSATFLGVIVALAFWRGSERNSELPAEHFLAAMRAGLRYARKSPSLRATLVRAVAFFLFASAYWALLPLIAREQLKGGPELYGILLACIGIGAAAGALLLPRIKAAVSADRLVAIGTVTTALVLIVFAVTASPVIAAIACLIAGVAWITVLSSLNVSAQVALPHWVKARGLSLYLVTFFGSMTGGSLLWGQAAERIGIPATLLMAAVASMIALVMVSGRRLAGAESLDLAPSMHWPAPMIANEIAHDRGPVLVTVEYQVDLNQVENFVTTLNEFSQERRRDGAFTWGLFEDSARPGFFLEYFLIESWLEHLRQHQRVTGADRDLQESVMEFLVAGAAPKVSHFLAPEHTGKKDSETAI